MSEIIPAGSVAVIYDTADPKMMLRIIDGAEGPGLVSLETLRSISAAIEAEIIERVAALEAEPPQQSGRDGASAYQLAVASGFAGSLAQWLVSLQGAPGAAASVEVGTVKALAAGASPTVKNTGAASKATLEFGIPAGAAGKDGAPRRIERYTGTVAGAQGIATITFPEFVAPPLGQVVTTWDGAQMVTGQVTATTKTTATVKVMKSVATLLLNASPFTVAPAGQVVTIDVFGN